MRNLPSFLNLQTSAVERRTQALMDTVASYQPLLGVWVIDLALGLGWTHRAPGHSPARFFGCPEFAVTTGLRGMSRLFQRSPADDDDDDLMLDLGVRRRAGPGLDEFLDEPADEPPRRRGGRRRTAPDPESVELERRLLAHRDTLVRRGVAGNLPLFTNIERLARLVLLNDTEKAILAFTTAITCFSCLHELLSTRRLSISDDELINVLTLVSGHDADAVRRALRPDSVLISSGLITLDHDQEPLPLKISLMTHLRPAMLDELSSDEELSHRVLKPSSPPTLTLDDFPHLQHDTALLKAYLQGAAQRRASSVNILLYGPPGTGKTEYARALVAALGWRLFEIDYADSDGDPLTPVGRVQSMAFSQRALKHRESVALLFDEVEDVLPGEQRGGFNFLEMLRKRSNTVQAKAWVNRMLEENPVPTLWITNDASIDTAYLRRFDYSLQLGIPPQPVRRRILQRLVGSQLPGERALDSLAALEDLLPAQVERAARVATFAGLEDETACWQGIARTLSHSRALLGQGKVNLQLDDNVSYSLDYLNADTDLEALARGLTNLRRGSLCLYGPPGTGKTAFGRHLAELLGCGLLVRRASDLMSKWVGESERNVARAFAQAEREGAVLLMDEVDSFLRDRGQARSQWEVTLVNEMLTQMESFQGVFIASTNLMADLDEASLRRFDMKIRFGYLQAEAARQLLQSYCRTLGLCAPDDACLRDLGSAATLTPGDFAAVARRHRFHPLASPEQLVAALLAETRLKKAPSGRPMGFV